MEKILNRITWILSFVLASVIVFGFSGLYRDFWYYFFGAFWGYWFAILILGFIIKSSLFSKNYIKRSLNVENKTEEIIEEKDSSIEEIREKIIAREKMQEKEEKIKNISETNRVKKQEVIEEEEPSKLKNFFAENLLAKIGGILLALGIIYLMALVYTAVGPVAKLIIGFVVGFGVYFIGTWLFKKGFIAEAFILLGTGILINYIVILGGRYLLPGVDNSAVNSFTPLLSTGVTFGFLLLNTAFSVLTSYIYSSRNILIFSIFFAYFIPFIVGSTGSDYSFLVVVSYAFLISIASLFVSNQKFKEGDVITSKILFYFSIILGNLSVLAAPISPNADLEALSFTTKVIGLNLITFSNIALALKHNFTKDVLISFVLMGIFTLLYNIAFVIPELSLSYFLPIFITTFIFLFASFFLSNKKDFSYLYSVGTLFTILILAPIIQVKGELINLSIIGVVLFGILNYLLPFVNKNLVKNDMKNVIFGSVIGVLFLGVELYNFGKEYFPGVTLGFAFLALAIVYFIGGYLIFSKFEKLDKEEKTSSLNFIYTIFGIAISLFSVSVALVFSNLPLVVALIWILESNVVLFFTKKLNSKKVFAAGIILFIIGLIKQLIATGSLNGMGDLVPVFFIFVAIFLNVFFFKGLQFKGINFLKVLHIFGMILIFANLLEIFNLNFFGDDSKIYILAGIFLAVIGILLNLLKDTFLKKAYILTLGLLFIHQILFTHNLNSYDYNIYLEYLGDADSYKLIYTYNYISSGIILGILAIEYFFFKDALAKWIYTIFGIYFFLITSLYLHHITGDVFSLTIYWGILAFVGVHLGIAKTNLYMRGIGLYLLVITLLKIVSYDVWNATNSDILRIIAFIFVGAIMIYISVLYSKNKLSLKKDFVFEK